MTKARLEQIVEHAGYLAEQAEGIYKGDSDNYDGADGARAVLRLCNFINELVDEVKPKETV